MTTISRMTSPRRFGESDGLMGAVVDAAARRLLHMIPRYVLTSSEAIANRMGAPDEQMKE
jgi:hypothetical protein